MSVSLFAASIVSVAFFALVAPADAGQTFYVKPADDANSCVTTAVACATVEK